MSSEELEAKLSSLVERSLQDNQLKEEIVFDIPEKTIKIAWKKFINLRRYKCSIHSNEIRHIYNEHGDEVYHICKIHYHLEKFKYIERTTTRETHTGKNIPCFTITKQLEDKKLKIVQLHLSRNKTLSLKTLYEVV